MCSGLDQPLIYISFTRFLLSDQRGGGGGHGPFVLPPLSYASAWRHMTHLMWLVFNNQLGYYNASS